MQRLPALFLAPPALPHLLRGRSRAARAMCASTRRSALVDAAWLAAELPRVTVLDASWHLATLQRDARAEYLAERIPGARRFDIDAPGLADQASSLPHMLPDPFDFGRAVIALGVSADTPVVVYSASGFVGAARAWWMFRVYGKDDVYVLDGGLAAWKAAGLPVESGPPAEGKPAATPFLVKENRRLVRSMADMLAQIESGDGVIVDARSHGRFDGTSPEPRPDLIGGHMPGAFCLPSNRCTDGQGKLLPVDKLRAVLKESGLDDQVLAKSPISLTCGSGVTAAIDALALYELGVEAAVYDGSWSEYGAHHDNPVVKV